MAFFPSIKFITTGLYNEYLALWNAASIKSTALPKVKLAYDKMIANKPRYEAVANRLNMAGVPWYLIAVIHYRESDFNFNTHLHNGDSLKARTVNVPINRPNFAPANGKVYTWEESTIDALMMKIIEPKTMIEAWSKGKTDNSIQSLLHKLETWNGSGYRPSSLGSKAIPSPYLWSDSSIQQAGKYIADSKFSATTTDQQLGAATLLKYFLQQQQEAKKKD
jgi:lysozyme family protein